MTDAPKDPKQLRREQGYPETAAPVAAPTVTPVVVSVAPVALVAPVAIPVPPAAGVFQSFEASVASLVHKLEGK